MAGQIAAGQHGLITIGHAIESGITDGQIRRRLRTDEWRRERQGVFAVSSAPQTWEQQVLGAVLVAGPG
ncbi:MAG: type IV toxin-antitoxin system AbiEi family antitoxin domain-containing protein, partial [Acidimicrobiia bacterium]